MVVTLQDILLQLRLEPEDYPEDSPQSDHLLSLAESALSYCNHYTGQSYTLDDITPSSRIALLMLIDHFHKNTSATSPVDLKEVPFAVKANLNVDKVDFV